MNYEEIYEWEEIIFPARIEQKYQALWFWHYASKWT